MQRMTSQEATRRIAAATASELFGPGSPENPDEARRARRTYRVLVALVHPDVAVRAGLDATQAQAATGRLNDLYATWRHATTASTATSPDAAPHVVGEHGTYALHRRIHAGTALATYTSDDAARVTIARMPGGAIDAFTQPTSTLDAQGMAAFAPHVIDQGVLDGRGWACWTAPGGLVSLADVRAAFPGGLDGRDWAWMARRIVMVLDAAGQPHGALDAATVFIHPGGHGVVLTGWGANGPAPASADSAALTALFDQMLARGRDDERQRAFAARAGGLSAGRFLTEYDLLLTHLYGPRTYRPFVMPTVA